MDSPVPKLDYLCNIYDFNKYIYTCIYIYKYVYKENTEVMMKLGQAMADTGRVEDGLKLTQQAIDKDPHFLIAYLNKAKMHIQVSQAGCARCMYSINVTKVLTEQMDNQTISYHNK